MIGWAGAIENRKQVWEGIVEMENGSEGILERETERTRYKKFPILKNGNQLSQF